MGPPRIDFFDPQDSASGGVEAIDQQILILLSQRFAFARHHGEASAHDDDMRRQSLAAIRRKAFELGIPVSLVADFWDRMFDASAAMRDQAIMQQRVMRD